MEDESLGWKTKSNQQISHQAIDTLGTAITIEYTTSAEGFKAFGNPNSTKKKVFFIGDSFTQAVGSFKFKYLLRNIERAT